MKITDCKIKLIENGAQLKGIANVSLDNEFLVRDIKIVEGKEGLFIAMPSKKVEIEGQVKHIDVAHPLNNTFREILSKAILEAYAKELKAPKADK